MIFGITHDDAGEPVVRLTKAFKVSIGIPAGDGRNYPSKDDHFHIRAKNGQGEWVDDRAFETRLQEINMKEIEVDGKKQRLPLREFDIIFLSDVLEEVFHTEYAWWAKSEKKCSGDGRKAQRRITAIPEKERAQYREQMIPWKNCGTKACPELDKGMCKPSGELVFIFKDRPVMGSVATLTTTSYESIRRICSSLTQIQSITGGRLRGIPLKLVVRPGKTRFEQDGVVKNSHAFFLNIEFRQEDYTQLVPTLLQHSAQYESSMKSGRLLGKHVEEEEPIDVEIVPEAERAKEMTSEFYPDNAAAGPSTSDDSTNTIFAAMGLNPVHRDMLYQSLKGDLGDVHKWMESFAAGVHLLKLTAIQTQELYARLVVQPQNLQSTLDQMLRQPAAEPAGKKKRTKPEPPAQAATPTPRPAAAPAPQPAQPEPAKQVTAEVVREEELGAFEF